MPSVDALTIAPEVRRDVAEFVDQVATAYGTSLVSIFAFGSVVTGDYDPGESDVNLMVVDASIDVEDLERVGDLSRKWLKRRLIAPRFLSRRNFDDYVRMFQVDMLSMRGATVTLAGEDLISGVAIDASALRWQAAYEIKAMRLRIKQQFWRVEADNRLLRSIILQRFTSLTHLMRAALLLQGAPAPAGRADVVEAAITHLGLQRSLADAVANLRREHTPPAHAELVTIFKALLDAIRLVDAAVSEAQR
jgi:hypothetical protein